MGQPYLKEIFWDPSWGVPMLLVNSTNDNVACLCRLFFTMSYVKCLMSLSLYLLPPHVRIGPMSHVEFKKCPCRPGLSISGVKGHSFAMQTKISIFLQCRWSVHKLTVGTHYYFLPGNRPKEYRYEKEPYFP